MNEFHRKLSKLLAKQQLIALRRPFVKEELEGCVVGVGEQFVLLHYLDCGFRLNGHLAIRISDIRSCRLLIKNDRIAERVLKLRGDVPVPLPQISLVNLPELLLSAFRQYPLVTIHTELRDPDVCFIGEVAKITERTVTLDEIDPAAKWTRTRRHRLDDITRVDIGGAYEDALLLAATHGRQKRREQKHTT